MAIKIAMIGGGSRSFGPAVIRDVLLSDALCDAGAELVLMDAHRAHLPENEAYARRLMARLGRRLRLSVTTDLDAALRRAQYVVVAIDIDRFRLWSEDFNIPRKHGFNQVFGENGGPGGIFHALRNMGPVLRIARGMEKRCPEALMLNFSNPEHKLCEAVSRLSRIASVGLCHGFAIGRRQIAMLLDMPADDLETAACGINHFTWFQTIRHKRTGEDLYSALRRAERKAPWTAHWHEIALGRVLFRLHGLWPSPGTNHYGEYIRWAGEFMASELHWYYDAMEGEPWVTGNIPPFVYYIDGVQTRPPPGKRSPAPAKGPEEAPRPSGELAIPIIEGLALGRRHQLGAINVPNRGAIPGLPDDAVVEVPAVVDRRGLRPSRMQELPEAVTAMLRVQTSIHKLTVEAFAERSRTKLLQAILLDPTVDSYRRAVSMMNEMLKLQQKHLPRFR